MTKRMELAPGKVYGTTRKIKARCIRSWTEYDGTIAALLEGTMDHARFEAYNIVTAEDDETIIWEYTKNTHIADFYERSRE